MPFVLLNNVYLLIMRSSLLAACLLAFCAVCLFQQCEYENIEDNYPPPPTSPCDSATISYMADIEPIIVQSCAISGCHASGGPQSELTTYDQVKFYVDNGLFKSWVIDRYPMLCLLEHRLLMRNFKKLAHGLTKEHVKTKSVSL